jgi:hypothetical protein
MEYSKTENNSEDIQHYLTKSSIFRIGTVSSVDGRAVSVRVDRDKNLSHLLYQGELLKNVSVGSYIKILKGFDCLIGKIEKEYIKEITTNDNYATPSDKIARFLSIQLVGYFEGDEYKKGVKELPLIGDECLILEQNEYQRIHNFTGKEEISIRLGHLMTDSNISIDISVNKLFASHIGVFGNTGSGKSYTLASLYKELFDKFGRNTSFKENARFLLFDFNGEYASDTSITKLKKVYNLSTQTDCGNKIELSPDIILAPDIFFILSNATEKTQQPFIRRMLKLYNKVQSQDDSLSYTKGILRNQLKRTLQIADLITGDTLLAYFEKILPFEENLLSDIGRQSKSNCFYYIQESKNYFFNDPANANFIEQTKIYRAIDKLEVDAEFITWITKFLYIQLIDDILSNRAQNEHIAPAINKLNSLSKDFSKVITVPPHKTPITLWEKEKPMVVINLDKVNTAMKKLLPLLLSMMCYQEHKSYKTEETVTKSLNIIIDEAHNILSYESTRESESWKDFRLETFEEIIKEGRKFGVFLTLASQRPSDISSTIISQLHNYLIHRLINNRDLEMVEKAISYLDKLSVETLPILPAGACVLSGTIADLPIIVQVERLSDELAPKSQTIKLTDAWSDTTTLLEKHEK